MQTTRIFAPWQNEASLSNGDAWHEIARPQVHGHDINCVTIIQGKGNHRYVSGADEKVARVFEATLSFLKTLNHAVSQDSVFEDLQTGVQVLGANMSALGLSQKPIYVQGESLSQLAHNLLSTPLACVESYRFSVPCAMKLIYYVLRTYISW